MGFGNYSHEAHQAIVRGRAKTPRQEVFKQRSCHALMNPKGVRARECRDSDTNPNSLGIAFALDVTGSMRDIPELLAQSELPKFMKLLLECGVVDPQVLFMAVGDAKCDRAPLQVGQFEATGELMDQWLTWSFLEGGGGGNGGESYELALYFAAKHTAMDCFEKRQERGVLILTGDDRPFPTISKQEVKDVCGDTLEADLPIEEVLREAQKSFDVFFLVPDAGRSGCTSAWRALLGDHVIQMKRASDTCYVAAGLIGLRQGVIRDLQDLAEKLHSSGADGNIVLSTRAALEDYSASRHKS